MKAIYTKQDKALDVHSWNTVFLSNHDNPRVVSAFGDDSARFRVASAKLLATMLLTLKGTPFIYQGDELGMTNYPFTSIDQFDDIEVKNGWKADGLTGKVNVEAYIANLRKTSRDNSRTPMQWDGSANGGFTTGAKAWLAVNPNTKEINAAAETKDAGSVYSYFSRMVKLREKTPALVYGDFVDLDPENAHVFAYARTLGAEKYLVLLNFSGDDVRYSLPQGMKTGTLLITNLTGLQPRNAIMTTLQAWEARIYRQ